MVVLALIVFAVALLVLGPIAVIWAINTLFGLGVAVTFKTWLAVVVLLTALTPQTVRRKQ